MSRTKRKPYTKSKAVDKSCRCHGGCPYCLNNRMRKHKVRTQAADLQLRDIQQDDDPQTQK